jgi:kinase suppressor of Ras 2
MESRITAKRFSLGTELEQYQYMIDSSARSLDALRMLGSTNSLTVQQEVRELESKLIRLFSRQLMLLTSIDAETLASEPDLQKYPNVRQWLEVVGLQKSTIEVCTFRVIVGQRRCATLLCVGGDAAECRPA